MGRYDNLDEDDISDALFYLVKRMRAEHKAETELLESKILYLQKELAESEQRIADLEKLESMGTGFIEMYEKELHRLRNT
jgi:hypothetical protein